MSHLAGFAGPFSMNAALAKISRTTHWVTSALGLASLIFFSITGITLNHPDWFSAERHVSETVIQLERSWLDTFQQAPQTAQLAQLTHLVDKYWALPVPRNIDRDAVEWVLDYQRPGGVATVILDVSAGRLVLEQVDDGAIALINDLHKGRHSGRAWSLLIDGVAVVCLFFAITGLVLLWVYARKRTSTWPLVILGALVPLIIYGVYVP